MFEQLRDTADGSPERAELKRAAVSESARRLIDTGTESFDFVFIDADKPSYPEYIRVSLELTHPGSVIVIDNVVRNGALIDPDSLVNDCSAYPRATPAERARIASTYAVMARKPKRPA